MRENWQFALIIAGFFLNLAAIVFGVLYNRSEANGLRTEMNASIESLRVDLGGRIDTGLSSLSGRVDMMIKIFADHIDTHHAK